MNLIYKIHNYGISVSYSCDITKYEKQFGAPTPLALFISK